MTLKHRFDEVNEEKKELKNQLDERDAQLKELKAKASGNDDLTGEPEVMDDVGETTPGKITANKDVARKMGWVKSYGANALSAMLSGDDPMRAIADLFGAGAVAWGNGSHPDIFQTEVVRQGLSLAGEDVLVNRRLPLLHPRGVKWTESIVAKTFPNFEELENGTYWERVYEPKAVRVVIFVFKIDE